MVLLVMYVVATIAAFLFYGIPNYCLLANEGEAVPKRNEEMLQHPKNGMCTRGG